jgi:heat shock protein HslJ
MAHAACGSSIGKAASPGTTAPSGGSSLNGTHWILVSTHATARVPAATPFTIQFDATTASGAGPCNRYHMPFKLDGDKVTAGPVASTQIACAQPLLTAEQHYFAAIEKVDTAQVQDAQLVLTGPDNTRLVYEKADDAE